MQAGLCGGNRVSAACCATGRRSLWSARRTASDKSAPRKESSHVKLCIFVYAGIDETATSIAYRVASAIAYMYGWHMHHHQHLGTTERIGSIVRGGMQRLGCLIRARHQMSACALHMVIYT